MDLSYETKNESISKKTKIGQIYCGRYDLEKIPLHGSTKTLIVPKVIEKQHLNNPIGRLVTNSGELHLKIVTFNANGAVGSKSSIKNMSRVCNILALQETMHSTKEKLLDAIRTDNKNIFQIPARRNKSTGRYSGGMAFVVDKFINAMPFFPHENISYLLINQYAIINIYMPYFKSVNSENYFRYVEDLANLEQVIIKVQQQNKQVILLGDMNADFIDMNQHARNCVNSL